MLFDWFKSKANKTQVMPTHQPKAEGGFSIVKLLVLLLMVVSGNVARAGIPTYKDLDPADQEDALRKMDHSIEAINMCLEYAQYRPMCDIALAEVNKRSGYRLSGASQNACDRATAIEGALTPSQLEACNAQRTVQRLS